VRSKGLCYEERQKKVGESTYERRITVGQIDEVFILRTHPCGNINE
jgi:hypothetical protein